jgi:hypothetical protein
MNFIVPEELFHKKNPSTGKKNYLSRNRIKNTFLVKI